LWSAIDWRTGCHVALASQKPERTDGKPMDLVQMRDLLEELAGRSDRGALLDVVFGVLQKADKIIEDQAIEIQHLRKQLFGRRSEKLSPDQLSLFSSVIGAIAGNSLSSSSDDRDGPSTRADNGKERRKRNRGKQTRRPLIPTQSHVIPVPDSERACPSCGGPRCTLGHVRSIVVEYTPPKIDVIEFQREKIVCRPCDGEITLAPAPAQKVVDRALPGPQMLAALTINKGVDGLPLNRTRKIFIRSGLDIPMQTLNRWEGYAYKVLEPVIPLIRGAVLASDTINLDDTGLHVLDPTVPGGVVKGHVWVFVGRKYHPGGHLEKTLETVFYLYAPTWHAKHPEEFLHGCTAAIQGDAYRGYERIASPDSGDAIGKLLAGCCMHARRPFVQALESKDPCAIFFVEKFQQLYQVEAEARSKKLLAHERLQLRAERSIPILNDIKGRAQELAALPLTKPMKQGVGYLLNQWDKLLVPFRQDGRLEIDNGSAERYLRRVASGRKSWFFAGSHGGAQRFASVLSIVSSAEAVGVDPGSYITDIIQTVDSWPNKQIADLLPHRWREIKSKHPGE
jgi:transposase